MTLRFGVLPLVRCARCGLRGIPIASPRCPGCSARTGWAQVDRAAFLTFCYALQAERLAMRDRLVRQISEHMPGRMQTQPIAFKASPIETSQLDPVMNQRAVAAVHAALSMTAWPNY